MIAVLVDQIDVGGAQVPLHSIVKPCIRRPDVSGELGATLRVDAPRVSNGSPRLSSMNPSRLSDTATTQAAHARQLDSMKNLLLNSRTGDRAPHGSEERRVGKSVEPHGRREIEYKMT